jgi:hypothetical protein
MAGMEDDIDMPMAMHTLLEGQYFRRAKTRLMIVRAIAHKHDYYLWMKLQVLLIIRPKICMKAYKLRLQLLIAQIEYYKKCRSYFVLEKGN